MFFFFISDTYIFFFPIRKSVLPPIEHLNDLFLIYNLIDTSEMKASSDQSIQFGRDMHLITRRRYAILSFPGFFKKSSPFIVSYIYIYIYICILFMLRSSYSLKNYFGCRCSNRALRRDYFICPVGIFHQIDSLDFR